MTSTDGLYSVTHVQNFLGQEVLNTYFYERAVGTGASADLASDFNSVMIPHIQAVQSGVVTYKELFVANLGDLADFDEYILTSTGVVDAEPLPVFNALSFTYKPNTRAVRHGGKRIAGVPENVETAGEILDTTYLAAMETLRNALAAPMVGLANTWNPILIKRVKTAIPGTTPVRYRYSLPGVGDDATVAGILSVLVSNFVSHQVSRKRTA